MTDEKKPTHRTITLTSEAPVRIQIDQWPVIADSEQHEYDSEHHFQANRREHLWLKVRQHADGRALVYAVYEYDSAFQGERGLTAKVGTLCPAGADLVQAIRQIGRELEQALADGGREPYVSVGTVVRACIADLPAREL